MSRVGARIREVRNARGLTLSYVADMLHLSEATMSRYETGERKIVADLLAPLGEAMGVDPCLFLESGAVRPSLTVESRPDYGKAIYERAQEKLSQIDPVRLATVIDFLEWQESRGE